MKEGSSRRIPFVDLRRQTELHSSEWQDAIRNVLHSGRFIGGDELSTFEREFASYVGCSEGVGVASGSDAIRLTLLAMGVGPGDEVATVSHTFVSTVDSIIHCGAKPVFVDIEPASMNMDPVALEQVMSPKVKVVLPVHLYGQSADMDPILEIASKHGARVLEDAAQAHGAAYKGKPCGSMGDASCFSFYPAKNLGALGDGGFVATRNTGISEKVRLLREYGQRQKYNHTLIGFNSRLDSLQAAILMRKLHYLREWNEARRRAARIYHEALDSIPGITLPEEMDGRRHVWHLYSIRSPRRNYLRDRLTAENIESGVHYPVPVHLQPSYAAIRYRSGKLDCTVETANTQLSLPMFPEITDEELVIVAGVLRAALDGT